MLEATGHDFWPRIARQTREKWFSSLPPPAKEAAGAGWQFRRRSPGQSRSRGEFSVRLFDCLGRTIQLSAAARPQAGYRVTVSIVLIFALLFATFENRGADVFDPVQRPVRAGRRNQRPVASWDQSQLLGLYRPYRAVRRGRAQRYRHCEPH